MLTILPSNRVRIGPRENAPTPPATNDVILDLDQRGQVIVFRNGHWESVEGDLVVDLSSVPTGAIGVLAGSFSDIPAGWAFCDGTGGTTDLRGAILQCVQTGESPGPGGYVLVSSDKPALP